MIQLFRDEGVTLDQKDKHGNNVFHYISDLAIDGPERAIRCYKLCRTIYPDVQVKQRINNKLIRICPYVWPVERFN